MVRANSKQFAPSFREENYTERKVHPITARPAEGPRPPQISVSKSQLLPSAALRPDYTQSGAVPQPEEVSYATES